MDFSLEVVLVPVSDVDRAKAFYVEKLGFNLDVDHQPSEDFRVVQMTPPGSACSVTVGKGLTDASPGSYRGTQLIVRDIEAARGTDPDPSLAPGRATDNGPRDLSRVRGSSSASGTSGSDGSPTSDAAEAGSAEPAAPEGRPTSGATPGPGCSTWEGGTFGVGFGGGPSCSYTAAKPGGYTGQGQWRISIKRGETTIEVDSKKDPSCSQTGFIQPKDEVTAWVAMYSGYNSISVGDDAHC